MSEQAPTATTPPESLGAETGTHVRLGALPDFDVFDAISDLTTDTLKRIAEREV